MPDSATSANTPAGASGDARPWIVLIVDDEPAVHQVTRLALRNFDFDGRALELLSAYSVAEAKRALGERDDVAVILLDVVMETESAGLDLVRHIREDIGNEAIRIVLRTGQPGYAPEERIVRDYDINDYRDKTDLTAQKLSTTLYAALRSYRDIRRLQEATAMLARSTSAAKAAASARDAFVRTASHELRTPLNAIVGFADIMRLQAHGAFPDSRYLECAQVIHRSGTTFLGMVDNILEATEDRDHAIKLRESAFDLAECVDACLSQLELGNTRRTLRLEDGAPIRICADFTAVQRMLLALLVGVLRESDPSRRVEAAARKLGDGRIILYIIDDGADIDQALLTRMSDAKGDEAYYEEETGLGIGFAVARLLIEQHGGELRLEARGAGGMRANLIFPKERAAD